MVKHKRHKRAKNITLRIENDGSIVITRPWFVPKKLAEIFLKEKRGWIEDRLIELKNKKRVRPGGSQADYLKNKKQARELILSRLEYFNQYYKFTYKRLSIRNQKSRWGSCSQDGNLNFNYQVLALTKEMQDYIVVHELCHLKELNHSRNFWDLVSKTIPNYREIRRKLRGIE